MQVIDQLADQILTAWARGDPRLFSAMLFVASILLYMVAANLAWVYRASASDRGTQVSNLAHNPFVRLFYELIRFGYYLLVPFAALMMGWVDVRALGLDYLNWADGLRWTVVLALAAWSLLMTVWVPFLKATSRVPASLEVAELTWSRRLIEAIYMQAHWAFYRAVCILLLVGRFPGELSIYWGTFLGLAVVAIEAWADPRVRRHIAGPGEGELALWSAGQAVVAAVGFLLMRNVWLLTVLHLVLEFSVPHLRARPRLETEARKPMATPPPPPRPVRVSDVAKQE